MVYILLGTGFEEIEAITPCDILRRSGVQVALAGIGGRMVTGGHGIVVQADVLVAEIDFHQLDMLVVPGGLGGVQSIEKSDIAMAAIHRAYNAGKYVGAICAGPTVLAKLSMTDGKRVTGYPGTEAQMPKAVCTGAAVTCDGRIITAQAAGSAVAFGLKLAEALCGAETARRVAAEIVVRAGGLADNTQQLL